MASTGSSSSIAETEPLAVRPSDVVVGIQSYNDAETIEGVVGSVRRGIQRAAGGGHGCVVLADGRSTDETIARARQALGEEYELITVDYQRPEVDPLKLPYHGRPGRPAAMRSVFRAAREREARACVMLDARLTNLQPEWVELLIEPALKGDVDYVSAHYVRHPYEGAITKSIIYPLFRALYGVRLRQPASLEFGCSAPLMDYFLQQRFWDAEEAPTGIDLWLPASAIAGGFRLGEALLGVRTASARPVAPDLSTALAQIVGALLSDLQPRAHVWHRVRGSVPLPAFGVSPVVIPDPPPVKVETLLDSFRLGYTALRDVWAWILPPRAIMELKRLADARPEQFRMSDELWARILYDFALGIRLKPMPPDHLLGALVPLYLGWLASFILELGSADPETTDRRIERLCAAFEAQKPYLISRWRWPERFRS